MNKLEHLIYILESFLLDYFAKDFTYNSYIAHMS